MPPLETVLSPLPAPVFSGLGPIFNNNACDSCHPKNGRGRPPRDGERMASMFLRVSLPGTDPLTGGPLAVPGMGTQLQHLANFGVLPEADVVYQRRVQRRHVWRRRGV